MTHNDEETPRVDAPRHDDVYSTDAALHSLGATIDEGPEDDSAEKDAVLLRLLTTDMRPGGWDADTLDELVEPPPSEAPSLTLARRTSLIAAVSTELEEYWRTSGSLEQVLHRMRLASGKTQTQTAAEVTELTRALTGETERTVTADDIKEIETTLATVDDNDDYARTVAAAWATVIDLTPEVVSRSFAKSLQRATDPPLGLVAGRSTRGPGAAPAPKLVDFEALYKRAQELNATLTPNDK